MGRSLELSRGGWGWFWGISGHRNSLGGEVLFPALPLSSGLATLGTYRRLSGLSYKTGRLDQIGVGTLFL